MNRHQLSLRLAALAGASAVIGVIAAGPAAAAGSGAGDVKVVNTETVQVYTSPSGQVQNRRVYEQLALTGKGSVDLSNPVSTDHLRNLDGFGGFTVKGGDQIVQATVDGEKKLRTVSDFNGSLPLDVSVAYKLDGKPVQPGDVVGKSGHLQVTFTVQNVTARPQQVSFDDGKGGTVTKTVQVPIPMVGSLTTTAPASFTNVHSGSANMAGDGKGGTQLSFTMTLFPPIGSDTAVFGYDADITDGVVPRAEVSALPVDPLQSPTFKSAAGSYKGGADTGVQLTDGATQIDGNLLKLRDGAAKLLAGLLKLRDGAGQLRDGLTVSALPGSQQLADGAGRLDTGLGRLNSGSKRLAAGTGEAFAGSKDLRAGAKRLSAGTDTAAAGSKRLAAGAHQLDDGMATLDGNIPTLSTGVGALADGQSKLADGLKSLYDGVNAMPASVKQQLQTNPDYQTLLGTLGAIIAGIGTPSDVSTSTLMGGLNLLQYGMRSPYTPAACDQTQTDGNPSNDCGIGDATQIMAGKFDAGATQIQTQLLPAALGAYDFVHAMEPATCPARETSGPFAGLPPVAVIGAPAGTYPQECVAAAASAYGYGLPANLLPGDQAAGGLYEQSKAARDKLNLITAGIDTKVVPGILSIKKGLYNASCNPLQTDKTAGDFCGIAQALGLIKAGVPQLVDELTATISGQLLGNIGQPTAGCDPTKTLRCAAAALAAGGTDLVTGVDTLSAGVRQLKAGSGKVSAGADDLSSGLGRLSAGGHQLRAGAGDLAEGLGRIDAGAGDLADGASQAKDGSAQVADGADQLASGLKDAADGSTRLADGLAQAAGGAPKLRDGAQELSDRGTKKLVGAGQSTAQSYGEMYATMAAGAQRARSESMAFGAPKGAVGLTAYSYVIQGDDGEGGRNLARGVGGLALLGAGAGAFALRRRFV